MGRFSLLPKEEQYFSFFSQMTSYIYDAARALVEMLNDKDGDKSEHLKRIKAIEQHSSGRDGELQQRKSSTLSHARLRVLY